MGVQASCPQDAPSAADAVQFFSAEAAVWMRQNGVKAPNVGEAARLRVLSRDRLLQQRAAGDLDGAVETLMEARLESGATPTEDERKLYRGQVETFFAAASPRLHMST